MAAVLLIWSFFSGRQHPPWTLFVWWNETIANVALSVLALDLYLIIHHDTHHVWLYTEREMMLLVRLSHILCYLSLFPNNNEHKQEIFSRKLLSCWHTKIWVMLAFIIYPIKKPHCLDKEIFKHALFVKTWLFVKNKFLKCCKYFHGNTTRTAIKWLYANQVVNEQKIFPVIISYMVTMLLHLSTNIQQHVFAFRCECKVNRLVLKPKEPSVKWFALNTGRKRDESLDA